MEKTLNERSDFMEYPKPIMRLSELIKLGHSKEVLLQVAHMTGSPAYKRKTNGKSKNSPWYFYTNKLDEAIKKVTC